MLKVVLVRTEGDENIGSAARAMMNMGEKDLVLINPGCNHLSDGAFRFAVHAGEVLKNAAVFSDLKNALAGSEISAAVSRRNGQWRKRDFDLNEFADFLLDYKDRNVALVFGK